MPLEDQKVFIIRENQNLSNRFDRESVYLLSFDLDFLLKNKQELTKNVG